MESTIFRPFEQCRVNELSITRDGVVRPDYILTDGQFFYGRLTTTGSMWRDTLLETADGKWLIKQPSLFSRETSIISVPGSTIAGKATRQKWNSKVDLEMADGFNAVLIKQGIFSRNYNWHNNQYGDFITLKGLFSYSKPYMITIDQGITKTQPNIPLIILIGLQIVLLKQSRPAAL